MLKEIERLENKFVPDKLPEIFVFIQSTDKNIYHKKGEAFTLEQIKEFEDGIPADKCSKYGPDVIILMGYDDSPPGTPGEIQEMLSRDGTQITEELRQNQPQHIR